MPAIVQIVVKKDGVPVPGSPFTNAYDSLDYGVGHPVCVQYPDNLNVDGEVFTFEISILVKTGGTFSYVSFIKLTVEDDEMLDTGEDGVVDFVLGNCNLTEPDIQLPPYQNLPTTATVLFTHPADPGYWGVKVTGVNPAAPQYAYDLPQNINMAGWCGDQFNFISPGSHTVHVYGTMTDLNWPTGMPWSLGKITQVNWLFNNLGSFGMSMSGMTNAQGDVLQEAIWGILQSKAVAGMAASMVTQASSHSNFVPLPGGWGAVLLIKDDDPDLYQLIFTIVDP
jgi:hypothetical protein